MPLMQWQINISHTIYNSPQCTYKKWGIFEFHALRIIWKVAMKVIKEKREGVKRQTQRHSEANTTADFFVHTIIPILSKTAQNAVMSRK